MTLEARLLSVCAGGVRPYLTAGSDAYAKDEATAHLITAAPLLLEALGNMCDHLEYFAANDVEALRDARYAIDVAKGVARKGQIQ